MKNWKYRKNIWWSCFKLNTKQKKKLKKCYDFYILLEHNINYNIILFNHLNKIRFFCLNQRKKDKIVLANLFLKEFPVKLIGQEEREIDKDLIVMSHGILLRIDIWNNLAKNIGFFLKFIF